MRSAGSSAVFGHLPSPRNEVPSIETWRVLIPPREISLSRSVLSLYALRRIIPASRGYPSQRQ
jgi:hypothetical protein